MTVRSAPAIVGHGFALAAILGAFTYTGGRLAGYQRDPMVDEMGRKEYLRKNRRRPIEGTVNQLGEGRGKSCEPWMEVFAQLGALCTDGHLGVYAPGYEERRAERLKENYGIDVRNPAPAVGPPSPQ